MTRILTFLTVVLFLGFAGNALAQREVPPPANTPFDTQPSTASTKALPKPVQAATGTEKVKTGARPAPVQAATVPITTEASSAVPEKRPQKTKKLAKPANSGSKKSAAAEKPKKTKPPKICKTTGGEKNKKLAQKKKASTKTAKKTDRKPVMRATTVPLE